MGCKEVVWTYKREPHHDCKPHANALVTWLLDVHGSREMNLDLNLSNNYYSYLEPTSFKHSDISWYPVPKFYEDDISHHKFFCIDIVFLSITEDSGFLQKENPASNCHLELSWPNRQLVSNSRGENANQGSSQQKQRNDLKACKYRQYYECEYT